MGVRICLLIAFGFLIQNLQAQSNSIRGEVVDNEGQPLYLALVYNTDLGIGSYTDENGYFEINTDKYPSELEVFVLGYSRKYIKLEGINSFLNIMVDELAYDLEKIEVTPCPKTDFSLGLEPNQELFTRHSGSSEFSYQVGKSFPTHYGQEITAVEVYSINPGHRRAVFRLRIYSLDITGKPDKDLLLESLIVRVPRWRTKRPTVIDLSEYNLRSPNPGIFIAKEWLPGENNKHRTTSRNAQGKRIISYVTIPTLGLIRTERNPDFKVWTKRDEGEWTKTDFPLLDRKNDDEVLLPAIRVHVRDCK